MKLHKRILKSDAVAGMLCALAAMLIRLVHATTRWTVVDGHVPRGFWDRGEPFVLAFWHGRMLMTPFCWNPAVPVSMLVSGHRDGQLGARAMRHLGIGSVTGSRTRDGAAGLRALLRRLKGGACVAIAPDGPRGPRYRAGNGVVDVARLSRCAVVPLAYSTTRARVLPSWDRFLVALPFGRGAIVWGEPIRVPADARGDAADTWRQRIEDALTTAANEADRRCGRPPIEPAPLADAAAEGRT